MNSAISLTPALVAGFLIGAVFFGGLWWTVRKAVTSQSPALWFLGSLLLRVSMVLAGFYFVGRESWQRWLACLIGFALARLVARRLAPPTQHALRGPPPESSYAP